MQAGIHPIIVICKNKQITPDRIFPCNIKDNQGKKKAITYLMFLVSFFGRAFISELFLILVLIDCFLVLIFQYPFSRIEFDYESD
ncbi:hypothetical protein BC624_10728 [Flavobacterium granuli]|uniref:Uncharacterized protein n=1 Tax=Flavobacterium granuli TaxID=280093 RepID=A0A1M5Q098_9FLAO|nr:hypothetical protein BC624_10728 [Flavobacterium granuli]SHH07677.1 hypothetical protein SAMN05443373_10728 [Flavobacterium granuli]